MRGGNNFIDLTGKQFGRLIVIERVGTNSSGGAIWRCVCTCNNINEVAVSSSSLLTGHTKSCGCLRHDQNLIHGDSYTRLYGIWHGMKIRCNNPKMQDYPTYGGQGITVCDEWNNNYTSFRDWAYENGYTDELTIDRIDLTGNYEPNNCRWATRKEQQNNLKSNLHFSMNGECHTLSEWCDIVGLPYRTVHARIHRYGWTFEQAITTPIQTRN